jgi:hypothetical protein
MARLRVLAVSPVLALLALLAPASALAAPTSQVLDPYVVLFNSGQALQNVQAVRFSYSLDMEGADPNGSLNFSFSGSGEFQAPDRVRFGMGADLSVLFGAAGEFLLIRDQVWVREPGGTWMTPAELGAGPISAPAPSFENLVTGIAVSTAGDAYVVTGDVDLGALGAPGLGGGGSFSVTVQTETWYPTRAEMVMTLSTVGLQAPGAGSVRVAMDLWDFNSPSIRIEPPV